MWQFTAGLDSNSQMILIMSVLMINLLYRVENERNKAKHCPKDNCSYTQNSWLQAERPQYYQQSQEIYDDAP